MENTIKINTVLATKDGRLIGNGLVINIYNDVFVVKTDYGNIVRLSLNELTNYYYVMDMAMADHKNYVR